ncbi:unnamed protein product [Phytophthora lilii]|uniref:Unnamed protein product n=1 Tax=Phytophthora lilii TaxID=2077276 RepID=A0A9W6XCX2_9STRA|nr:unnamed protein product [Phytophthora lilii]
MLQQLAFAAAIVHASAVSQVAAHGNLIVPPPTGDSDHVFYFGGPAGSIDMPEMVGTAPYGETYGKDISKCGNTEKNGKPQPVPSDGYALHDNLGSSHTGPCAIWCDDTRVFHDTNCASKFAGQAPARIPIDMSTCQSSSELVFYWLALHVQPWQVYINCVALDGSCAGPTNSNSTIPTEDSESESTEASVAAEASEDEEVTDVPATTETPTVTTAPKTKMPAATTAPSTSSSKCLRRHK